MKELSSTISLCMKAGKLALGFDAVVDAALSGKARLIMITEDTAAKTEKEIRYRCEQKAEIIQIPMTQAQIGLALPRRVGVLAVTDRGLATKLLGIVERLKGDR